MPNDSRGLTRRKRRADLAETAAAFEQLVPVVSLRKKLAEILAYSIGAAHAASFGAWEVTLGFSPALVRLNVGMVLTWSLEPRGLWLTYRPTALSMEDRRVLKEAELEHGKFKSNPQLRHARYEIEAVPGLWDLIKGAHTEALREAGRNWTSSPYRNAHSPGVITHLARVLGRDLPQPTHRSATRELVELVRRRYRDWAGFDDPRMVEEERDYKVYLCDRARDWLEKETLEGLLEAGDAAGFVDRLDRLGKEKGNNLLYRGVPRAGDLGILYQERLDKPAFCRQVFDLLYGEGESAQWLGRYSEWVSDQGLPNKWTFPTFLLWARHPEEEVFVKPTVAAASIRLLGSDLELGPAPNGDDYVEFRELVLGLKQDLAEYGPRDVTDLQSFLWVAVRMGEAGILGPAARTQVGSLIEEFQKTYPQSKGGKAHFELYVTARAEAKVNFRDLVERQVRGEDFTDQALLQLLPHGDTQGNRERGAWHSWAPAVTKDIKTWFEGAGWAKPEDWPATAQALLAFVKKATETPEQLETAVQGFAADCPIKGLQSGIVTPILNALRPDAFIVFNSKSRRLINYLTEENLGQSLSDYVKANPLGLALVDELTDTFVGKELESTDPVDVFDMFAHWLVAEKRFDFGKRHYWKVAPGEGAWQWDECRSEGFIGIGWSELGDLTELDKKAVTQRWEETATRLGWKKGGLYQVRRFLRIQEGDVIVANHGTSGLLGIGTVSGPYYYAPDAPQGNRYSVEWEDLAPRRVTKPSWISTVRELDADEVAQMRRAPLDPEPKSLGPRPRWAGPAAQPPPKPPVTGKRKPSGPPEYTLAMWSTDSGFDEATLERWVRALERKGQAIFYGPPGTGKTFMAERMAKHLIGGGDGFCELVQFHPSYAYEDFIQGIRPEPGLDGRLVFNMKSGRFLDFCAKSKEKKDRCVLIIDEINRANLSRVFGELMYLLEYRNQSVPLAGGGEFSMPSEVRIIGTMNTADRSIALVDNALRRRFAFLALQPNLNVLESFFEDESADFSPSGLIEALTQVNTAINNPHYEIGISFFLLKDLPEQIEDIWRMEIEPYLEEYFFDQEPKVAALRWDKLGDKILPSD